METVFTLARKLRKALDGSTCRSIVGPLGFEPLEPRTLFNHVTLDFVSGTPDVTFVRTPDGYECTVLAGTTFDVLVKTKKVEAFKFKGKVMGFDLRFMTDPVPGLILDDWETAPPFFGIDFSLDTSNNDDAVSGSGDTKKTGPLGIFSVNAPIAEGAFTISLDPNGTDVLTNYGLATQGNGFLVAPKLTVHVLPPVILKPSLTGIPLAPVISGEKIPIQFNFDNPEAFGFKTTGTYAGFLSTDQTYSQDDIPLLMNDPFSMKFASNGSAGFRESFQPPADTPDGNYFVIGVVNFDQSGVSIPDNFIASDTSFAFSHGFGVVPGRDKEVNKVAIKDGDGVVGVATFKGMTGKLIQDSNGNWKVVVDNSSSKSSSKIASSTKGQRVGLGDVTSATPLGTLDLKGANLTGNMNLGGGVNKVSLGNSQDHHLITIGGSASDGPVTFEFDRVTDTTIFSSRPIKSITATDWLEGADTDEEEIDRISAPSLDVLKIKGDKKRGIAGDFQASIVLGNGQAKKTLGSVSVAGTVAGSNILSAGNIGSVTVGAFIDSLLAAGFTDAPAGLPSQILVAASIASFTVKDVPGDLNGFSASRLIGANIGNVTLKDVNVADSGTPLGVVADTLKAYTRRNAAGVVVAKLSKLSDPIDDAEQIAGDDFAVKII